MASKKKFVSTREALKALEQYYHQIPQENVFHGVRFEVDKALEVMRNQIKFGTDYNRTNVYDLDTLNALLKNGVIKPQVYTKLIE